MNQTTRTLTRAALVAALYLLLTIIFQPISFGPVQLRIAEALMLLPILLPEAVGGLFAGCLLANLLGGGAWFDVLLGSLATLLAAMAVRRLRKFPLLAAAAPVICNGLIVGPVVYMAYLRAPGAAMNLPALLGAIGTVALGEMLVCYVLGMVVLRALQRLPHHHLGT